MIFGRKSGWNDAVLFTTRRRNVPTEFPRLAKTFAALSNKKHNEFPTTGTIIVGSKIISKPDAAIRVIEYNLSAVTKKSLNIGDDKNLDVASGRTSHYTASIEVDAKSPGK